jgi:predicted N-acyltransferase
MKPILHIKLPETASHEEFLEITKNVRESVSDEYHVLLTYGIEMQILNGEQLTELTFEEFKKQYIK